MSHEMTKNIDVRIHFITSDVIAQSAIEYSEKDPYCG